MLVNPLLPLGLYIVDAVVQESDLVSELPAFSAGSGVIVWVLEEAEHPPGGYVFTVLLIWFEEFQVAKGLSGADCVQ